MKKAKLFVFAIVLTFSTLVLNAQTLRIDSSQISFEGKVRPCLSAQVDSDQDALAAGWASYLKSIYKIKLKGFGLFSNSDVFEAKDIIVLELSDKRLNFYTKIIPVSSGSQINVFASYGYDLFIGSSSYPHEYKVLGDMLHDFLLKYLNNYYSDKVKSISKEVKGLNNEKLKRLKKIEKNNKKIFKLSNDIAVKNATMNKTNEEAIKIIEDVSKYSSEKVTLENENSTSLLRVQLIDKELNALSEALNKVNQKQSALY
jgi:hypothetical protein